MHRKLYYTVDLLLWLVCVCMCLQSWPEATDPHKFVYEDIAIASYLLVSGSGSRVLYLLGTYWVPII